MTFGNNTPCSSFMIPMIVLRTNVLWFSSNPVIYRLGAAMHPDEASYVIVNSTPNNHLLPSYRVDGAFDRPIN